MACENLVDSVVVPALTQVVKITQCLSALETKLNQLQKVPQDPQRLLEILSLFWRTQWRFKEL